MKEFVWEFFRRGLIASGFGPIILVVLYLILQCQGKLQTVPVNQVCLGIVSLWVLAFIAGGMNAVYQNEQIPLMIAILIHGGVLYSGYLAAYLLNGWLKWGSAPILVFTVFFVVGYFLIWGIIYTIIKSRTRKINEILKQKQQKVSN